MRIYLSGPITYSPEHKKHFARAEQMVLKAGHEPVNPLTIGMQLLSIRGEELAGADEKTWYREVMKADIVELLNCDAILCLKNWETSKGARAEILLGEALGLKIYEENGILLFEEGE